MVELPGGGSQALLIVVHGEAAVAAAPVVAVGGKTVNRWDRRFKGIRASSLNSEQ